jgi:hypothetical protein
LFDDLDSQPQQRIASAMKRPVCLIILSLFASQLSRPEQRHARDSSGAAETICITSNFSVEIDYPNFVVSILAHLTGAHISSLTLVEWDIRTPVLNSFLLHLTEGTDQWVDIASDTAYPSFVKLPREDRTVITPRALKFIKSLLRFFRAQRADTIHGEFEYGPDTLGARAFQQYASVEPGFLTTTVSRVETWNESTGEDYISGEVRAVTQAGSTYYPDIRIVLKNKNIKMHFTPVDVNVARTRP